MCNRDNARDIAACPDEQSTRRSEPKKSSTNQGKIATVFKTYLNDLKKYLTTFQIVILCKSSYKSTYCNSFNPCKL